MIDKTVKTWSTPAVREEGRIIPCTLCGGLEFKRHLSCREEKVPFFYVRCKKCGLVQINPQPGPDLTAARYDGNYGGDYLAYELANEKSFLRLQELALRDAGFFDSEKEKGRVLDIGCAAGALLETLSARGWEAAGVEISSPQAAYCRKRGLRVFDKPLEENHLPPESFDVVLASHLIEHLNDPGRFAAEVFLILKKGGAFYVTTPNIQGFQARIFGNRWRSAIFDHLYLFSVKTLTGLLENAGFLIEKKALWGGLAAGTAPAPVKSLFDRAAKRFGFGDVMILRARR
ncbi:MAG: methyltransferase domain-containing protein, partial [Treponema sp.]|nr:methyltransferase domain-containing protein [Treponema sp.]